MLIQKTVMMFVPVILTGCFATTTEYVRMDPPPDTQDGRYLVSVSTKDRCSGPVRSYDYEVTVKEGQIVGTPKLRGKASSTGTCQQVLVGVAKGILPSAVTFAVGMDRNNAIEHAAEVRAKASNYAVDNTKPPEFYEDNRIFVGTDVDVDVGVGGFCGDKCGR